MTARLPDWEQRLSDYLASVATSEFQWGVQDCALHIANAVIAMTGDDPAQAYRGRYADRAGAAEALRKFGAGTLLKTLQAQFEEKPFPFAQRGDLVWNGKAVGICIGDTALFVGEDNGDIGLIRVPRHEWKRAFAV